MATYRGKKILVLPSWYPPRGGEFFKEHSQALAAEGLDVTVVASIETSLRKHGLRAWLWGKGIPKVSHNKDINPGAFNEYRSIFRTLPLLYRSNIERWIRHAEQMTARWIRYNGKPDLIQAHSSIWAGVVAARIKKRYGIRYVITEHRSRFVFNTPEAEKMFAPWHYPLLEEAFGQADQIVTVSGSLQKKICEIAPKHIGTITTIPNMVDTRFFTPALKPPPPQPFRFFALAHLEPVKGFDTLIDAIYLLKQDGAPDFRLVIGGDGSQRNQLESQADRLGLSHCISFAGALTRPRVLQHLHAAHAFVLPSRFEAFGVVFIEAMACGLPVIAGRSGGPESFITNDCGIIVNPDQPAELAATMAVMMEEYSRYNHDTIWKNTLNKYSPKVIAEQYIDLYQMTG